VPDILFERRADGVALITLNRPDSLNALGGEMSALLPQYLAECATDPAVRCVVVTGTGRAFCAGGDVRGMDARNAASAPADGAPSPAAALARAVQSFRAFHAGISYVLHTMPKPTIAMVNGVAAGGGLGMALACDLRIASDRARFTTAFRNVGVSGDFGGTYFLQRLVGMGKARELYFTAEILDAETALRLGMVNRVVPHEELERECLELAARLAAGPTLAFARMKENLNLAEHADLRTLMDQEALNLYLSFQTEDHRAAARAFVERTTPVFRGA
jgi:2-(1,2-epoxy-1,2-dihydrophenyl)acetyl-CoA isomerase